MIICLTRTGLLAIVTHPVSRDQCYQVANGQVDVLRLLLAWAVFGERIRMVPASPRGALLYRVPEAPHRGKRDFGIASAVAGVAADHDVKDQLDPIQKADGSELKWFND